MRIVQFLTLLPSLRLLTWCCTTNFLVAAVVKTLGVSRNEVSRNVMSITSLASEYNNKIIKISYKYFIILGLQVFTQEQSLNVLGTMLFGTPASSEAHLDPFFVLHFLFNSFDGVGRLNLKSDSLPRQSFNENLHVVNIIVILEQDNFNSIILIRLF